LNFDDCSEQAQRERCNGKSGNQPDKPRELTKTIKPD
jgi:hypothetical protein